ncbi:MAG: bifunctional precorrin-2 dehydrogenase/sirohydrochlorin ferrochelatase [Deltaproteobacteria bacterium]|nr:bifunctional precorrin-2 dehydrogenase/sirohydrochlorin ferrochelatase [Deltaproteobacteria bacterium]
MTMFLPISINITNKQILIIGGGNVALEKIRSLEKFIDRITILATDVCSEIKDCPYTIIYKNYEKVDLNNYFLVYACTNNTETNYEIRNDCDELGILVNVADNTNQSNFISPAIYKQKNMTVSVSSNGEDVKKSIKWRNNIKTLFEYDGIRLEK